MEGEETNQIKFTHYALIEIREYNHYKSMDLIVNPLVSEVEDDCLSKCRN